MRGRKPTPTYLKLLKGNPGKRAIRPTVEPPRPAAPPPPPDFLIGYAMGQGQPRAFRPRRAD
jgi:hypothetical protein